MRYKLLIWIGLFSVASWAQDEVNDTFERANELYVAGSYDDAMQLYDGIWKSGVFSGGLAYNMGNTYLKQGDVGNAILFYKRALIMEENDDVLNNLKEARKRVQDPIPIFEDFFLTKWWRALLFSLGTNGWAVVSLVFVFVSACTTTYWVINKEKRRRPILHIGIGAGLIGLLALLLAYTSLKESRHLQPAVIMTEDSILYAASDERSEEVRRLSSGIEIDVLDVIGEWSKVRLPDRDVGWLRPGTFKKVAWE